MKSPYLIILLIFLPVFIYSQSTIHIKYFNLCNSGDSLSYYKKYDKALKIYETAFAMVQYHHIDKLLNAAYTAQKLKNFDKVKAYIREAIINGKNPNFLNNKKWQKFKKSDQYNQLLDSIFSFRHKFESKTNRDYLDILDSLHFIDQFIIRQNFRFYANYKIDESKLPENRFELDKSNFAALLKLIHKYGFPSEQLLGPIGYGKAWIILHHNVRLPENSQYIHMLKESVSQGKWLAEDFAWMYDQSCLNHEQEPYYYWRVRRFNHLNKKKKLIIEARRREIGLKSIHCESFIKDPKTKQIKRIQLW